MSRPTPRRPDSDPEAEPRPAGPHGHPHGKLTSWVLVAVVLAAFATGGAALAIHRWWIFWVCVGVVVASFPVGLALHIMDDTMAWTHPLPPAYRGRTTREAARRHRDSRPEHR